MKPAIHLEESERDGVSRTLVTVMEHTALAESEGVGRCKFEQVRLRLLIVPLVEGSGQRCIKQILVTNAGACPAEKRNKALVCRQRNPRADPTWLLHFFESSA